ncbi:hypothetical protein D9619_013318 [Psilocybe cf. subviscida]|uniref:Uncharacterized protein n=1 Tax=Psilocybe cf. subviscida TaxID=2480587 RepID=A0A8H5BRW2_9AGAR|nr:hypothetical protein D9619_013318 [Psilocybe cf. subviscida]
MILLDHSHMHTCNGDRRPLSATSRFSHPRDQGNMDPFNVAEMKHQLQEISAASILPRYRPTHQLILNQIDTRLSRINTINTVTGGAYDDVCKFYKDIGIFASKAKNLENQARNAVASHENLPIAKHPSEARAWKAKSDVLEFDWTFYSAIKDWAQLAEDWTLEVSKDMDAINATIYPLQEKLSTQKKRIEELHRKMQTSKCEMDVLIYELETCSIELEDGEMVKVTDEKKWDDLNLQSIAVPYLHDIFDAPHWSEEDELGIFALEARKLYNVALDIERRVYLS